MRHTMIMDLKTLHGTLYFLFTSGPKYGLSTNGTKAELHTLNDAPQVTIVITPKMHPTTCGLQGNLRSFYQYIGTYFLNKPQNQKMPVLLYNTVI